MENEQKNMSGVVQLSGAWSIFKKAWNLYKLNYKKIYILALLPAVLNTWYIYSEILLNNSGSLKNSPVYVALAIISAVVLIISMIISVISYIAILKTVQIIDTEPGADINPTNIFNQSVKMFFPYLWVAIMVGLMNFGAMLPFVIPGMILSVFLAFAIYSFVIDDQKGIKAGAVSFYLVRNNFWKMVWRLIFIMFVYIVAIMILSIPFSFIFPSITQPLVQMVVSIVMIPIISAYFYFFYQELKLAKGGLSFITEEQHQKFKKWCIGLSIWGVVGTIAIVTVVMIILGIGFLLAFLNAGSAVRL